MKIHIAIVFLSLCFYASGIKSDSFSPHMIFHEIEGCPENSLCQKEYGKKRKKYMDSLKSKEKRKSYFNRNGAPFRFYAPKTFIGNKSSYAIWDSHCGHFRTKGKEVLEIETFTKKINQNNKFMAKNVLVSKGDKLHQFKIPINADPLKMINQELFFETKEDFKFYLYAAKDNGLIRVAEGIKGSSFSYTKCPKNLLSLYSKVKNNAYRSYYCQKDRSGSVYLISKACL